MEYKDYYSILGLARDAGADAIKRAYRTLARKYHPDINREKDAEARFRDINEAYEVLKDPEKRTAYDQLGADWQNAGAANAGHNEFRGASGQDFSEFFSSLFGQARAEEQGYAGFSRRGADQQIAVSISLEDAFHGAKQSLRLNRPVTNSEGRILMQPQTLNIAIPRGVTAGQRVRLEGQGLPGPGGGEPGDLYLEIQFAPHPLFRAEKRDIHLELPVAPWEAALGATVTVPTLGGKVQLKIPAHSQSGNKLRLKGKGLCTARNAGDQIVTLKVVLPEANTGAEQAIYRDMAAKMSFNPRAGLGF